MTSYALKAGIFLGIKDDKPELAHINVCYDREHDVFLTTQDSPPISKGGYGACSCISDKEDSVKMVQWFREHQTDQLTDVLLIPQYLSGSRWIESGTREQCCEMFSPNYPDFSRLCHYSWCGC